MVLKNQFMHGTKLGFIDFNEFLQGVLFYFFYNSVTYLFGFKIFDIPFILIKIYSTFIYNMILIQLRIKDF